MLSLMDKYFIPERTQHMRFILLYSCQTSFTSFQYVKEFIDNAHYYICFAIHADSDTVDVGDDVFVWSG